MNNDGHEVDLSGQVRTMQIIVAAITAGPAMFLVFVLVTKAQVNPAAIQGTPMITYVASVAILPAIIARMVVPKLIVKSVRRSIAQGDQTAEGISGSENRGQGGRAPASDVTGLCAAFQTKTIVGAAMFEGVTFLMITAYMLEGQMLSLILTFPLLVGLAIHFPSQARVEHWIEDQLPLLEQDRQSL